MPDTTPNLALPEIASAQAQKHVTHNEALRALDALVHLAVLDRDLAAPPGSPTEGERWLVAAGASGEWSGKADQIAAWQDGGWLFYPPSVGWLAYVIDEEALLAWSGSAWEPALDLLGGATELQNMALLGLGTTADGTNPFSAKLNNALWTAKTEAEGGDGDLRYKLSKESAAKTLSLLFQDNFSGRAEIGLTGDDDLHFKVSDDGTTWRDAIVIDKSTGQVSFPQGGSSADLELTLAELSLGVADALNVAQFLGSSGNRFADSFDASTYVDVAGATNLDSGTAGLLKPTASAGSDLIPAMSGATTGGVTMSATSTTANHPAYKAADGTQPNATDSDWASGAEPSTGAPQYLTVDFGSPVTAASYTVGASGYSGGGLHTVAPNAWVLQGSTDNFSSSIVDLDSRTAVSSWSAAQNRSYSIVSPGSFRYYRLKITAQNGSGVVAVGKLQLATSGATNNVVVTSTALTAASAPGGAKLVARVREVDSIALNMDLIASASRDGGTTWSAFTLTKKYTSNTISVYESATLDVSGQPSGTSMKWKIATANNKMVEIHDIYFYWA